MYLWKCWRDTRIKLWVALGLFACLEFASLFNPPQTRGTFGQAQLQSAALTVLIVASYIVFFMGWVLGDDNPGADIGRGSGDFLLTRPSSRGSFVWTGWAVGMVESIILWIIFSTVLVADIFFQARRAHVAPFIPSLSPSFFRIDVPILLLMFLVNLGLIYGLTYCIGMITRSGARALIGSAALILGYQILKAIFLHRFHVSLPDFLLAYSMKHGLQIPAIHSFVIRGLIALAFPVLAHVALERMEI